MRRLGAVSGCGLSDGFSGREPHGPAVVVIATFSDTVALCRPCADRLAEIVRDAAAEVVKRRHDWRAA